MFHVRAILQEHGTKDEHTGENGQARSLKPGNTNLNHGDYAHPSLFRVCEAADLLLINLPGHLSPTTD